MDLVLSRWLAGRVEGPQQKRLEVNRGLPGTEEGAERGALALPRVLGTHAQ